MRTQVKELVCAIIGMRALRGKTPYKYTIEKDKLDELELLLREISISEISRSLIQGGTLNPHSITVKNDERTVLRIDEESFSEVCEERKVSGSSAREGLFYQQLLPAIFGDRPCEGVISCLIKPTKLNANHIGSGFPLVGVLVAMTNSPWLVYEGLVAKSLPDTFRRGWESPVATQPDKQLRSQITVKIETAGRTLVTVDRRYVVPLKPITENPPKKVLERFRICSTLAFDGAGKLESAAVRAGDFRLDQPWHDLEVALELVREQCDW